MTESAQLKRWRRQLRVKRLKRWADGREFGLRGWFMFQAGYRPGWRRVLLAVGERLPVR